MYSTTESAIDVQHRVNDVMRVGEAGLDRLHEELVFQPMSFLSNKLKATRDIQWFRKPIGDLI